MLDEAVTVKVWFSFAAPEVMPLKFTVCAPAFSFALTLPIAFKVGVWFTELTFTVNVFVTMLLLAPPSLTVTVIVAVPVPFATGVKVKLPVEFALV